MTTSILLNGIAAIAVRLVTPWDGVWIADVELAPDVPLPSLVSTPAALVIGTTPLVGWIDPEGSGVFGAKASARVVGGRAGWTKTVTPLHFKNDAGVLSTAVIAATAAQVLETAVVAIPQLLGVDYVRAAGPASRVLEGLDWHVDYKGVTQVAPRIPLPANPLTTDVLDYDPITKRVSVATDDVLSPGAILADSRFGVLIARDVEQTWTAGNPGRASVWCGSSTVSRAAGVLAKFIREKAGIAHLALRKYRVVVQGPDGRVALQAVKILGDFPSMLPIDVWPGMSGLSAQLTPATEVLVGFIDGDPAQPVVLGFSPLGVPLVLKLDAVTFVSCGEVAPQAVARMVGLTTWANEVEAALSSAGHPVATPWNTLASSITSTKLVTD